MAKRTGVWADAPEDFVYVSIYCDGRQTAEGPSHKGRPWLIATFSIEEEASRIQGSPFWATYGRTYTKGDRTVVDLGTQTPVTMLVGERVVSSSEAAYDPPGLRSNVDLSCRVCGLKYRVRRPRLDPILTRLAESGVKELTLCGLAAIL